MHMNGSELGLGALLGEIKAENGRQTEIALAGLREMQALRWDMHTLPERIAATLPPPVHAQAAAGSAKSAGSLIERLTKLAQALLPLGVLAAIVAGKVSWPEALPLLRQALAGL